MFKDGQISKFIFHFRSPCHLLKVERCHITKGAKVQHTAYSLVKDTPFVPWVYI